MSKQTSTFSNPVQFEEAVALLKSGSVCAFATETVYGLGGDATETGAVLEIYKTKNRPRFNPLIAHCSGLEMVRRLAVLEGRALKLTALWPGAITLVLPLKSNAQVSDLVTAGLPTIAVRIPSHPLARKLIEAVGRPLAAPSANPSGKLSPTNMNMVRKLFDDAVPVLEGGACEKGVESTILTVADDRVVQLRAGAISREEITKITGLDVALAPENSALQAPGMLKSHYAPRAQLRLNVEKPGPDELYLAFGSSSRHADANLSPSGNLEEAARNLFSILSELDATANATIAVAPIPSVGLGEAINDRLQRAAAPRDNAQA